MGNDTIARAHAEAHARARSLAKPALALSLKTSTTTTAPRRDGGRAPSAPRRRHRAAQGSARSPDAQGGGVTKGGGLGARRRPDLNHVVELRERIRELPGRRRAHLDADLSRHRPARRAQPQARAPSVARRPRVRWEAPRAAGVSRRARRLSRSPNGCPSVSHSRDRTRAAAAAHSGERLARSPRLCGDTRVRPHPHTAERGAVRFGPCRSQ